MRVSKDYRMVGYKMIYKLTVIMIKLLKSVKYILWQGSRSVLDFQQKRNSKARIGFRRFNEVLLKRNIGFD